MKESEIKRMIGSHERLQGLFRAMMSYGTDWSAWPRIQRAINHINHEDMMDQGERNIEWCKERYADTRKPPT